MTSEAKDPFAFLVNVATEAVTHKHSDLYLLEPSN